MVSVHGIRAAVVATGPRWCRWPTSARRSPRPPGSTPPTTCEAVLAHGARVDRFLHDDGGGLAVDAARIRAFGVEPVSAAVARPDGLAHDPGQLAKALQALL